MNDLFNEVFGATKTEQQTPIEIALGVDAQGMTTAKKLYSFLDLDPKNYSRWLRKNLFDNRFAEKDVDFFPFVINEECGGQVSTDAKLTASFAKKLSMMQKNKKGEAARNYFVGIENGTKNLVRQVPLTDHIGEVANYLKAMDRRMEKQGTAPYKIAEAFKLVSEQFGIRLPEDFVKVPEFEQMELSLK